MNSTTDQQQLWRAEIFGVCTCVKRGGKKEGWRERESHDCGKVESGYCEEP
jgi:hypothetical protein